ncbi:5-oxoprolinase subunit PxpB [Halobacillus litoralis]|uniref:5-oxoprolinase subunit PxpB n=1 Tax=Halobacillus litoralis TaxID=45668 RepID=UPI001CD3B1E2|nr:5-oxoprolinase subunit PxpB [Halobacillus litoralis]MCA0970486.1 5-oxoprolinase subunit PxpB [Halobacillus litoralis]
MKVSYAPLGDTGMQVVFGTEISKETNQMIRRMTDHLKTHPIEGVTEWVPAYTTLTLYYNPSVITYRALQDSLQRIFQNVQEQREAASASLVYILPTYYGGEDLSFVAEKNGLTEEEVVRIHSSEDYLIYMMGFVPGFPYLGGMSDQIATPRRDDPRPEIAPGSVGIAGSQTGVYPLTSPGGWQLIGRTPVKLYDPDQEEPILLESGHYIRFEPVSKDEYDRIEQEIERGEYTVQTEKKEEVMP